MKGSRTSGNPKIRQVKRDYNSHGNKDPYSSKEMRMTDAFSQMRDNPPPEKVIHADFFDGFKDDFDDTDLE